MVGRKAEAGGIAKDGAKMVMAVACAAVRAWAWAWAGSYPVQPTRLFSLHFSFSLSLPFCPHVSMYLSTCGTCMVSRMSLSRVKAPSDLSHCLSCTSAHAPAPRYPRSLSSSAAALARATTACAVSPTSFPRSAHVLLPHTSMVSLCSHSLVWAFTLMAPAVLSQRSHNSLIQLQGIALHVGIYDPTLRQYLPG